MQAVASSPSAISKFAYSSSLGKILLTEFGLAADVDDSDYDNKFNYKTSIDPVLHYKEYLRDQKERLLFDIEKLKNQVKKLEQQKVTLEAIVGNHSHGDFERLQVQIIHSNTIAEELGNMQKQTIEYSHKIDDLKEMNLPHIVEKLKNDNGILKREVEEMRMNGDKNREKIDALQNRIKEIRYSELYNEIETLRRRKSRLKNSLQAEFSKYKDLRSDIFRLSDTFSPSAVFLDSLNKKLKHYEKKNEKMKKVYINMRQSQIAEVQELCEPKSRAICFSNEKSATIRISNLPEYISSHLINTMFSTCGTIVSLSIVNNCSDDDVYAEISFAHEYEANNAISSFNGKKIDANRTIVINTLQ